MAPERGAALTCAGLEVPRRAKAKTSQARAKSFALSARHCERGQGRWLSCLRPLRIAARRRSSGALGHRPGARAEAASGAPPTVAGSRIAESGADPPFC